MAEFWAKTRFWSKIAAFGLLVLYLVFFVVENSGKPVKVWFWFGKEPETTMIPLVLWAFCTGVVGTVLVQATFKAIRQFQQMRDRGRAQRMERDREELRVKAGMLRTRTGDDGENPVKD